MSMPIPPREQRLRDWCARQNLPVTDFALLERALTHSSFAFENNLPHDNERLEFLGDAVLGMVVSEYLYRDHPRAREGVLSKHKSQMISRGVLGKRAFDMDLGPLILLGKGEEMHGGRTRPALLGSALEAVVGAFYLDFGLKPMNRWLEREIFEPAKQLSATDEFGDYKSLLQELVQKLHQTTPDYEIVSQSGPDHNKQFVVVVKIGDEARGQGEGARKKSAENQAAQQAYLALCQENGVKPAEVLTTLG